MLGLGFGLLLGTALGSELRPRFLAAAVLTWDSACLGVKGWVKAQELRVLGVLVVGGYGLEKLSCCKGLALQMLWLMAQKRCCGRNNDA